MTKLFFGAALAALALATPSIAPAQRTAAASIVVVDTQRIFAECTACRAAQTQLQTQVQQIQQRSQQLGQPLQTEAQAIQTAARGLNGKAPDAALQARITALQTKQNTANQELQNRQQQFQRNQAYVAQQINTRLDPIITQVMTTRGANIAIDKGTTLASAAALDVTNDVLAQLNQQLPSVNVNAPAQAQQQPAQGR